MRTVRRVPRPRGELRALLLATIMAGCSSGEDDTPGVVMPGAGEQRAGSSGCASGGRSDSCDGQGGDDAASVTTGGAMGASAGGTGGSFGAGGTGGSFGTGGTGGSFGTGGTGGSFGTGGTGVWSSVGGRASGDTGGTRNTGGNAGIGGCAGTHDTGGTSSTGGRAGRHGGVTGGSWGTGGASSVGGASCDGGTSTSGGTSAADGSGGTPTTPTQKFVGNITTSDSVNTDGKTFATYWDQITPENAGKWGQVQWSPGGYSWDTLDAIYDYAEANNIVFKEHCFIWDKQQPTFDIGEAQVKDWMQQFCSRYPNTKLIDVVNEPPPHTSPAYASSIGGGTDSSWQWIINAFKWADEACPNAILILNDYNNTEWPNDNSHFISIVKTIMAGGAPIDAIGAQAHDYDKVGFGTIKPLIEKLHSETGLPIYITEYDPSTSDDNQQLSWYKEQFPFFLETEYIHGITIWGWIYGRTWSSAPQSGLIRNGSPRPAMTWLMDTLGRPAP